MKSTHGSKVHPCFVADCEAHWEYSLYSTRVHWWVLCRRCLCSIAEYSIASPRHSCLPRWRQSLYRYDGCAACWNIAGSRLWFQTIPAVLPSACAMNRQSGQWISWVFDTKRVMCWPWDTRSNVSFFSIGPSTIARSFNFQHMASFEKKSKGGSFVFWSICYTIHLTLIRYGGWTTMLIRLWCFVLSSVKLSERVLSSDQSVTCQLSFWLCATSRTHDSHKYVFRWNVTWVHRDTRKWRSLNHRILHRVF